MLRPLLISTGVVVCVAALALTLVQRRQLASLKDQEQRLRGRTTEATQPIPAAASNGRVVSPTESHTPSIEVLRLRGQIGQLERRKRELAGVRQENERLQVQLATKGTNAPGGTVLPTGYLRKAEARFVGYDTPEDTIQTLLWAIQSRDTTRFVQAFTPEMARQMEAEIRRRASAEEFFKEADAMPGLRITGKEAGPDDTMVLTVEMLPGDQGHSLRFKQVAGQWKLVSGL